MEINDKSKIDKLARNKTSKEWRLVENAMI